MVKQILSCCKMLLIPLSRSALLCHAPIPQLMGVWGARLTDVSSSLEICSCGITPARVMLLSSLPHRQSGQSYTSSETTSFMSPSPSLSCFLHSVTCESTASVNSSPESLNPTLLLGYPTLGPTILWMT